MNHIYSLIPGTPEPIFDVAELSAVKLFLPDVDRTAWFFTDLLGMVETRRDAEAVSLRGWQHPYQHSLKVAYRRKPGMGAAIWRALSGSTRYRTPNRYAAREAELLIQG